ncbi:MAG: hypothetical protein HFE77_01775 [Clostridiales bacterium]|nr:hypothetical protein [Clostridiales bacterium]
MKVIDVISYVDKVCHNSLDGQVKIKMLERLDRQIARDVFDTHEGSPEYDLREYTESTELLVPDDFSELYFFYLESKIWLLLNQIARYQNMAVIYDTAYTAFVSDYNRTHKPKHPVSALRFA